MDVILLERIARLGQMGDVVRVKDGYARNFLLPKGKALRANDTNKAYFETQRRQLETRNLELKGEAEKIAAKLDKKSFVIIRSAGETGQLYGSASTRDIADAITAEGFSVARNQVELNQPIKTIGLHTLAISLHPEVEVLVVINIARSAEEAERQEKGEDLTKRDFTEEQIEEDFEDVEELGEEEDIAEAEEAAEGEE